MKVQELLIASQAKLRECGISDPIRDARLLLADCLELRTQNLNLLNDSYISEIKISKFRRMVKERCKSCLLYTSPSPRDGLLSRMPSSA